jgi:DNA topoisomerase-1
MSKPKLVIVESFTKTKKLNKILGKNYIVKASLGHIRDLVKNKKNIGIDVKNGFKPSYELINEKIHIVKDLQNSLKKCSGVILAADPDDEGEAICWHLCEVLKLCPKSTPRIVYTNITKEAILEAINNPKKIDMNRVYAQQSRQILDRLMGFEISPILWKNIMGKLSAGRVQSVVVRLIIDRENEIKKFESQSFFKVFGIFGKINGVLNKVFDNLDETMEFLNFCRETEFEISQIKESQHKRNPPPPYVTNSLLQDASNKYSIPLKAAMSSAQRLYEGGKITYHRTDSVALSNSIVDDIKGYILDKYGEDYLNIKQYKTKSKNAQEAHEAIRPTDIRTNELKEKKYSDMDRKMYRLIWRRTVASQMSPVISDILSAKILCDDEEEVYFTAKSEKIKFDGFTVIYNLGNSVNTDNLNDDGEENKMNDWKDFEKLNEGDILDYSKIQAIEKYTRPIGRFSDASLIKKMEDMGIGRPSTYVSIISKIVDRGYVIKDSIEGKDISMKILTLENKSNKSKGKEKIDVEEKMQNVGAENKKFFPTDIGRITTDFLIENFLDIMDYEFTTIIRDDIDRVAEGKMKWKDVVNKYYNKFHPTVEKLNKNKNKNKNKIGGGADMKHNKYTFRHIGKDPITKLPINIRLAKFGPVVELGEKDDEEYRIAGLFKGQQMDNISLDDALDLLEFPKKLGSYKGSDVILKIGKFGNYINIENRNIGLKDLEENDPFKITLKMVIPFIENFNSKKNESNILREIDKNCKILNAKYGRCILMNGKFAPLPKDVDYNKITMEDIKKIFEEYMINKKNKWSKKKNEQTSPTSPTSTKKIKKTNKNKRKN